MRKKQVKPAKVDKRYRQYSAESMLKAYEAVKVRKIPVSRAALQFGVPENTLRDRATGLVDAHNFTQGCGTTLDKAEEEDLIDHLHLMSNLGYSFTNGQLQQLVGELVFDLGRKTEIKRMSNSWLYGFLSRWDTHLSNLSLRSLDASNNNKTRYWTSCSTPEAVSYFYNELSEIMTRHKLFNKPQHIYNLCETGLQPTSSSRFKSEDVTSPPSVTSTLLGCVNANGNCVPPFFVFKGKRFNSDLMQGASSGARGAMSETGFTNGTIYRKYLKEHFLPYARRSTDDSKQPLLLLYDGHTSNLPFYLMKWAKSKNLILFLLPAHTSSLLQPLDVPMFIFNTIYYSECSAFRMKTSGQIVTRYDVCGLACKAYSKAMTPLNVQSGFQKTGIYPLCKEAVPMETFSPTKKVKKPKNGKKANKHVESESFTDSGVDENAVSVQQVDTYKDMSEHLYVSNQITYSETVEDIAGVDLCQEANEHGDKVMDSEEAAEEGSVDSDSEIMDANMEELSEEANELDAQVIGFETQDNNADSESDKDSEDSANSEIEEDRNGEDICKGTNELKDEVTNSENEENIAEEDLCCVCKEWTPPNENQHPYIKLITWAYCDKCPHCVHLTFCSPVRFVRRHSTFLCPCCETSVH